MGRFLIILGILIILAGAGVLFTFVFGIVDERPEFTKILITDIFCEPPEQLTQVREPSININRIGQSIVFYCDDREGNRRDITGDLVQLGIISFAIPMVIGMILVFTGAILASRRHQNYRRYILRQQAFMQPDAAQWDDVEVYRNLQVNSNFAHLPPEKQAQIQTILNTVLGSVVENAQPTLAERLQQIEDAHKQGLISQREYDNLRQAILDNTDDF